MIEDDQRSASRSRPVTLTDVARRAGVSQSTASRVINGSARRVDEHYRTLVLAAAAELGYTPNLAAQAIARGTSTTVALIASSITDAYFSHLTGELLRAAEAMDLRLAIAVSERRADREVELVREFRAQRARAIVLAGTGFRDAPAETLLSAELRRYQDEGGRVVMVSRTDMSFETVEFDNRTGARRLGEELVRRGYRAPLLLGSDKPLKTMEQRVEGFASAFTDAGLEVPEHRVLRPEFTWAGARSAVRSIDARTLAGVDLVFAITDEQALGALAGLRDRGVRVPEDLGIAGFDDVPTLRDVVPSLTTVHVPLDEVARETIRRAVVEPEEIRRRIVPTRPVLRDSTPPRA